MKKLLSIVLLSMCLFGDSQAHYRQLETPDTARNWSRALGIPLGTYTNRGFGKLKQFNAVYNNSNSIRDYIIANRHTNLKYSVAVEDMFYEQAFQAFYVEFTNPKEASEFCNILGAQLATIPNPYDKDYIYWTKILLPLINGKTFYDYNNWPLNVKSHWQAPNEFYRVDGSLYTINSTPNEAIIANGPGKYGYNDLAAQGRYYQADMQMSYWSWATTKEYTGNGMVNPTIGWNLYGYSHTTEYQFNLDKNPSSAICQWSPAAARYWFATQ